MLRSGDWIVPRLQGVLYSGKPPLGSWLIAICGAIRGEVDVAAIRLPTILAILLTTLLIYGYSRNFLSRFGAFASAVGFCTMGQVLQIGRLAETDGVFTLLTAASLMVWHWGYMKRWPSWLTWLAGYSLAAAAGSSWPRRGSPTSSASRA
ncbi:MAG: glycosyltransferase family 39 protein, partial [Chloroflexi bacterium]|nr:glycosyltransferase family 39 protein [Chloroflexota bacterium]